MFDETTVQIIKIIAIIIPLTSAIVGAVVSWVFKRTMARIDETEARVGRLEKEINTEDIRNLLKKIEELQKELYDVRVNYIHKQDFVREINKIDTKIDKILDAIVEIERNRNGL
ncbi:MAG: hypothetical protein Q4A29_03895 [Eubacteriales bacterium]|nr:hypothetical protein [Eubacteriales bacterium]